MRNNRCLNKRLPGVVVEWKPLGDVLARTQGTKITITKIDQLRKDIDAIVLEIAGDTQ